MSEFNAKCPVCDGLVYITYLSVRECNIQIRETGWAVMATHRNTGGSESFDCPKCLVTVPPSWVYKEMSQKEAQGLMQKWSGNVFSIHNKMPLPPPERLEDEAKKVERDADEEQAESDRKEAAESPVEDQRLAVRDDAPVSAAREGGQ